MELGQTLKGRIGYALNEKDAYKKRQILVNTKSVTKSTMLTHRI